MNPQLLEIDWLVWLERVSVTWKGWFNIDSLSLTRTAWTWTPLTWKLLQFFICLSWKQQSSDFLLCLPKTLVRHLKVGFYILKLLQINHTVDTWTIIQYNVISVDNFYSPCQMSIFDWKLYLVQASNIETFPFNLINNICVATLISSVNNVIWRYFQRGSYSSSQLNK